MDSEDTFNVSEDLFPAFDVTFTNHDESNLNITVSEDFNIQDAYKVLEIKFRTISNISLNEAEELFYKPELPKLQKLIEKVIVVVTDKIKTVQSSDELSEVKELLQIFINTLNLLCDAIECLCEKISAVCIKTLPISICQVLLITFRHCKESDSVYGHHFDILSDLLTAVFKKAIRVETSFLVALKNNLTFNLTHEDEFNLLLDVTESIAKIAEIHSTLDIQTASELWKTYIYLMQAYLDHLKKHLDLNDPLKFLTSEINNGLETITTLDCESEFKSIEKKLKICSFNLKVVIKLCGYSENLNECHKYLFDLLLTLHRFSTPFLMYEKCNAKLIDSIQIYVSVGAEPLLIQLINDHQFVSYYFKSISRCYDCENTRLSGVLLTITIAKKLINASNDVKNLWLHENEDSNIVFVIFSFVDKCYVEFGLDIPISLPASPDDNSHQTCTLYEYVLTYLSAIIVNLNPKQFCALETYLLRCILSENVWKSIFAADAWCILARYGSVDLCYQQLKVLINVFNKLRDCCSRPEFVNVGVLISRLYKLLTSKRKAELQNQFPIFRNVKLWSFIGLNACGSVVLADVYKKTIEVVRLFLNGNKMADFVHMCDLLELVSTAEKIDRNDENALNFVANFVKLWTLSTNPQLCESTWYQRFTLLRCKITGVFIGCFSNTDLLKVMSKLKKLLNENDEINLAITIVLTSLGAQYIEHSIEQPEILKTIAVLFNGVLNSQNPIVKQKSLEAFDFFAHHTQHEDVLREIVWNDGALQSEITDYLQKNVSLDNAAQKTYLTAQSKVMYVHKCVKSVQIIEPKQKKLKLALHDSEISLILQNMQENCTKLVGCLQNKNELTPENKDQINVIVGTLQSVL